MDSVLLMVAAFVGYLLFYRFYGRFIGQKIFNLSNENKTPAVEFEDGKDYVPTRKGIIFGHHFTSIAGAAPIVGPAIAVIWGWLPAIIWIFVGTVVMGAVHDFGALVLSLRNQGKSISEITAKYVNPRTRTIFFLIVLLELLIVITVFALVIGIIFTIFPQSVLAVWLEIPIAMVLGYFIYKKGKNLNLLTVLAVILMYATVVLGHFVPINLGAVAGIPTTGVWVIILLVYAFIASTLPVTTLLQPRDYINAWQLFVALVLLVVGVVAAGFSGKLDFVAPAVQLAPEGAPSLWPFLFITIACGAISGFHSLVSSGTTSKQVAKEEDARMIGYGSMLMEGTLSTLVIIAVAAGIGIAYTNADGETLTGVAAWTTHYSSWAAAGGLGAKINAFVVGAANMIAVVGLPKEIVIVIMGVFVASFAGTTLDTATRIQRYVVQELSSDLKVKFFMNKYAATAFAIITAGLLAFSTGADGKGGLSLWPLFGATNQVLAGLALLTISVYLKKKGGVKYLISLIPAAFMIVMTLWALVINERNYINGGNWLLVVLNSAIMLIAVWVVIEGAVAFLGSKPKAVAAEA
ncbi:MAG: carbon starvation protein A [Spirochaetales bacterium]|nr:carbon starvation protein A [Spirochaetales bacterium]